MRLIVGKTRTKPIVSVMMMLKEGWDVKNITTIVGLRPLPPIAKSCQSKQTLGRGHEECTSEEMTLMSM